MVTQGAKMGYKPFDIEPLTLAEWEAVIEGHNQNEERLDGRAALICMVLANCNRDPKQSPFTVDDFMPKAPRKPMTPEEMLQQIKANNALLGGKVEGDAVG